MARLCCVATDYGALCCFATHSVCVARLGDDDVCASDDRMRDVMGSLLDDGIETSTQMENRKVGISLCSVVFSSLFACNFRRFSICNECARECVCICSLYTQNTSELMMRRIISVPPLLLLPSAVVECHCGCCYCCYATACQSHSLARIHLDIISDDRQ